MRPVVDADPEVRGQARQPGRIPLSDRTELPLPAVPVQFAADQRRLGVGRDGEARQAGPGGAVHQEQFQPGQLTEGAAVRRGAEQDALDGRLQPGEIHLDGVRDGGARAPGAGRTAGVPLPDVPYGSGAVARLVVEDEVAVAAHPPVGGQQQGRGVGVRAAAGRLPGQLDPEVEHVDRKVRALGQGHSCHTQQCAQNAVRPRALRSVSRPATGADAPTGDR